MCKENRSAIHELSHTFCHEIGILRSEISQLRNSTTPSKILEQSSLQMENKDLKQRLQDLEMRHDALRLEAKALHDENKSLLTALRLLNGKIEKENKDSNLHTDESLGDPVQQDSEWNQVTSKKWKRQGKGTKTTSLIPTLNHEAALKIQVKRSRLSSYETQWLIIYMDGNFQREAYCLQIF